MTDTAYYYFNGEFLSDAELHPCLSHEDAVLRLRDRMAESDDAGWLELIELYA